MGLMGYTRHKHGHFCGNMGILQTSTCLKTPRAKILHWGIIGYTGTNGLTWALEGYVVHQWVNMGILQNLTCLITPRTKMLLLGTNGLYRASMG